MGYEEVEMDWSEVAEQRLTGLNELDEFLLKAYEISTLYKEKMKKYHDNKIEKLEVMVGDWCFYLIPDCACFQQTQVQMDWSLHGYPTIPSWSS